NRLQPAGAWHLHQDDGWSPGNVPPDVVGDELAVEPDRAAHVARDDELHGLAAIEVGDALGGGRTHANAKRGNCSSGRSTRRHQAHSPDSRLSLPPGWPARSRLKPL